MNLLTFVPYLLCLNFVKCFYEVPDVLIEALSPKGLRVSIPDEDHLSVFAFHGKINEEITRWETGSVYANITEPTNGKWTYRTTAPNLNVGDVVYYWVVIEYDERNGDRTFLTYSDHFTITELVSDGFVPTSTTTIRTTKTTNRSFCTKSPTRVNGKNSCKRKLIFQETFNSLNNAKWRAEVKFAEEPNFEFVMYQNSSTNLFLKNNSLHIKPTLTEEKYGPGFVNNGTELDLGHECTGILQTPSCVQTPRAWQILPPAISAKITTIDSFSFVYGVIEVRAKLPKGDWVYPEISLLPKSEVYGQGFDSGRIHIAFVHGNEKYNDYLKAGCSLSETVAGRGYGIKQKYSSKKWYDDFHVFRLLWNTDGIVMSVDGQDFGSVYPPPGGFAVEQVVLEVTPETADRWRKGTTMAPFDEEMYISIGVGVGGQCFSDLVDFDKPWDNDDPKGQLHFYQDQDTWSRTWDSDTQLVVDYVKVWAL